jgi:heat shock protein HslJ
MMVFQRGQMPNQFIRCLLFTSFLLVISGCTTISSKEIPFHSDPPTCDKLERIPANEPQIDPDTRLPIIFIVREATGEPPSLLEGDWKLTEYSRNRTLIPFPYLSQEYIRFGDNTYEGSDGCNEVWGEYAWDGRQGEICNRGMTLVGCYSINTVTSVDEHGEAITTEEHIDRYEAYPTFVETTSFEFVGGDLWFYVDKEKTEILRFTRE